jgi:hypothetical protein
VVQTLLEAVVLVVLVVILFLQTWRASIIPLIAVPVSVVGTFSILYLLGFSLNTLSLFGLVLAIGIVVDDAIVVVENVERNIEEGLLRLRRRIRRCVKCPGRLSRLRWCCARCLCRWRFSPAYRSVLQAVCGDDRDFDGDLRHQLADALSGAGGPAAKAARRAERFPDPAYRSSVRLDFPSV